jgi:spore coat protein CotH
MYYKHFFRFILCLLTLALFACRPEEPKPDNSGRTETPEEPEDPSTRRDYDFLFDLNAVPEITITVSKSEWNTYLTNFDNNPNNGKYVWASFTFRKGDLIYTRDSVGLRPRGNTSRIRPEGNAGEAHKNNAQWHHAHFGVKFTEAESGQRFFGADRLILKWFNNEPAYVREIYCYDLFRRFGVWTAPRASYCRLSISIEGDDKPVYMGVYAMIENPRKGWLDARFHDGKIPDKDGFLWKALYGANLSDGSFSHMGISDDEGNSYIYNLKTNKKRLNEAKQVLADFIYGIISRPNGSEELRQWLEEHMDMDLFLRAYAVNVMVGMWDDYWFNQNNYYFYFDSNHRFYFIPFDYDNALGTGTEKAGNPGTKDPLNWGPLDNSRKLMRKVMSIPEYRQRYITYMHQLASSGDLFAPDGSAERIRRWQEMVQPYVDNDTGKDCVIEDKPSKWSYYPAYRLLTGNVGDGISQESNFFKTKIHYLPAQN